MKSSYRYFIPTERQKTFGIYLTCAGHNYSSPGMDFPSHGHPDRYYFEWGTGRVLDEYQLIIVHDGEGTVEFHDGSFLVGPKMCFILRKGEWHRYRPNPKTGWHTSWIGFDGDSIPRCLTACGIVGKMHVLPISASLIAGIVERIDAALADKNMSGISHAAFLSAIIAEYADRHFAYSNRNDSETIIHRAKSYISDHSHEIIDFASLAATFKLSYRSFRYLFTRESGVPPLQFQLNERLSRAKHLLISSTIPIAEIANSTGFSTTWHFNHYFRKRVGITPSEFRGKRNRESLKYYGK